MGLKENQKSTKMRDPVLKGNQKETSYLECWMVLKGNQKETSYLEGPHLEKRPEMQLAPSRERRTLKSFSCFKLQSTQHSHYALSTGCQASPAMWGMLALPRLSNPANISHEAMTLAQDNGQSIKKVHE